MKIAFFVNVFPATSETFVVNQITGLIERGHDVDVFAARRPAAGQVVHPDIGAFRLLERTFYSPRLPYRPWVRWTKGLAMAAAYGWRRPRAVWRVLNPRGTPLRGTEALGTWFRGVPFLPRRRYDVVHAHFGHNAVRAAELRAAGLLDGPLVTSFHGFDMTHFFDRAPAGIYDRLLGEGERMLPISERWKGRLIEMGCAPGKIRVHRMGIDPSRFAFCERRRPEGEPLGLLSVARLTEKKGIEYAIRAVGKLAEDGVAVRYEIVGTGELLGELERLIAELKVGDRVTLAGPMTSRQVLEKMNEADVLVAPSVTGAGGDQEGIPVSIMEAMSTGLPVVSTWHSGIPELVEDGVTGFLVEERDSDGLADRLKRLNESCSLREAMGRAGRKRVERDYDIHKLNDQLVEIYAGLE